MRKIFFIFMLLFLQGGGFASADSSRMGEVTLSVDLSGQTQGQEAKLWIPYPVSDGRQLISDIKISGDYASSGVYTDETYGTAMLYAEWPKEATSRTLTMSFFAERKEIRQTGFPSKEPVWNPKDYSEYLKATSLGPVDGPVKALADKITKGKKTVLAKARTIYDWTINNMHRDPQTIGCGKGDVCLLLSQPGGKCTDISSVFVALCRAAGIPARELFSIRLGKKATEDITTWQHCWAEFFLPGYGWVTADPADVLKAMLVEKLTLDNPKVKEYREFFWGGIDPYRVVLAKGRDLVLNPRQAGPPLNTFGYPYAEIGGQPLDFYKPEAFKYTYTFKEKVE